MKSKAERKKDEVKDPIRKFVVVCLERTGSNFLTQTLDSIEGVVCYNEIFHRQKIIFEEKTWVENDLQAIIMRNNDPVAYLEYIFSGDIEKKEKPITHIGFKLFINHNADALNYIMSDQNVSIIFLTRANYLARYASFKLAQQTDIWSTTETLGESKKVEFIPHEFEAYYQSSKSLEQLFCQTCCTIGREKIEVEYANMKNEDSMNAIKNHLGLREKSHIFSPLKKQGQNDIAGRFFDPANVLDYLTKRNLIKWAYE